MEEGGRWRYSPTLTRLFPSPRRTAFKSLTEENSVFHSIEATNVNDAYVNGLWWLKVAGEEEQSRNGPVIAAPSPVVTVYQRPSQRVLFDALRDCNPFFHLFEAVWMLAGSRDVKPLLKYNKRMVDFAEGGEHIHGAYGDRWFRYFGFSQVRMIYDLLDCNKQDRQAVLQMWDCKSDLGASVKDKPCNTHCYFRVVRGRLDMTVCCRSNDIIWGAYGANAVHFSVLQEFMANALGIPIGCMYKFSNNFHIYKSVPRFDEIMRNPYLDVDPYKLKAKEWEHILQPGENPWYFLKECQDIVEGRDTRHVRCLWLRRLILPMIALWESRDRLILEGMEDCDWKVAFTEWLDRREDGRK